MHSICPLFDSESMILSLLFFRFLPLRSTLVAAATVVVVVLIKYLLSFGQSVDVALMIFYSFISFNFIIITCCLLSI